MTYRMDFYKSKIFQCVLLITSVTLVSSCASYHNLNEDGVNHLGGGFLDQQLDVGFYKLTVKTNFAPWPNFSGAWNTWNKRANELCSQQGNNQQGFESFEVEESSYNTAAGPGYVISQLKGFVYCSGSNIDKQDLERLISTNKH